MILELIAATLRLMAFLDNGLTVMVFTAVLGVVMVVAGLWGIARSRVSAPDAAVLDEPAVLRGVE